MDGRSVGFPIPQWIAGIPNGSKRLVAATALASSHQACRVRHRQESILGGRLVESDGEDSNSFLHIMKNHVCVCKYKKSCVYIYIIINYNIYIIKTQQKKENCSIHLPVVSIFLFKLKKRNENWMTQIWPSQTLTDSHPSQSTTAPRGAVVCLDHPPGELEGTSKKKKHGDHLGVEPKIGGKPPKWMVKIMENPIF